MVKNKKGGSGHKKYARKKVNNNNSGYSNRKLRRVEEEGEIYARIQRVYGGGHAEIYCTDGKVRTLVIRGKFRGRNKRDNTIKLNSIVIAGLRSVTMGEVVSTTKKEKPDLIYVYNDNNLKELKTIKEIHDILAPDDKDKRDRDCGFEITNKTIEAANEVDADVSDGDNKETFKMDDVDVNWDDI